MCGKIKVFEIKKELWNQIVDIPATMPTDSQKICFILKDEDVGKDDWYNGYFWIKSWWYNAMGIIII